MIALVLSVVDFLYTTLIAKRSIVDDDDDVAIFDLPRDAFNGVTLDTAIDADSMDVETFLAKLAKSLEIWQNTEVRKKDVTSCLTDNWFVIRGFSSLDLIEPSYRQVCFMGSLLND